MDDFRLTEHFWLHEFLVSEDHPELATELCPNQFQILSLYYLCALILEPTRTYLCGLAGRDMGIYISSGLRSPELNAAVNGHPQSLHLQAKACDLYPADPRYLSGMFLFIRDRLPYSWIQLIHYTKKNVLHVALPHPDVSRLCEVR